MIVGHMVAAAANSYGALVTLVLNGYGHDAMKIARSIYEVELNVLWLKNHPEEIRDFLDYNVIQQKLYFDAMDEGLQQAMPKDRYEEMMREYERILPRFATGRDKTRPRNEWCRASIYERAKEAEAYLAERLEPEGREGGYLSLYKTSYRHASSMHHLDVGGIIANMDSDMNAQMAPSWEHLDDALVFGTGSMLRLASYFDEMVKLSLNERLGNGPFADYVAACKNLHPSSPDDSPQGP
jgi:hypothetical protein